MKKMNKTTIFQIYFSNLVKNRAQGLQSKMSCQEDMYLKAKETLLQIFRKNQSK